MDPRYTYFLILACTLAGPLLLSFDKKVAFYKKWKYVFAAMILPAIVYLTWDAYFITKGVWSFNEKYITGPKLFNIPIEEVLFFFIVPYSCLFIYECVITYFPFVKQRNAGNNILQVIAVLLLVFGVYFFGKYYTSWTFLGLAAFIIIIYINKKLFAEFSGNAFLVSYLIVLIPFLLVNGFLTDIPVVLYNNAENTGVRIYSIPFEDIFYGMLLIMMNIVIYEKLRPSKEAGNNG
jgi:lycopene cyclase domain-containing protein